MQTGMIEVTGVPLEALVRAAYNPSQPRGLGALHFKPGDLADEEVAEIINRGRGGIRMDYVNGRACKFDVRREGERLFIKNRWYDHSDFELRGLLASVGLSPDLLDKAREEESRYNEACIQEAIAFLEGHGGTYLEKRDEELPERILHGLIYGSDPGPAIKREWIDGDVRYSLPQSHKGNAE